VAARHSSTLARLCTLLCLLVIADARAQDPSTTFLGPLPYRGFADSPFHKLSEGNQFAYFYLENFEDHLLNTPGVSASFPCKALGYPQSDSVDEDDGAIDGKGNRGVSCFSAYRTPIFIFRFSADALGGLPTHAGVVWTDSNGPRRGDAVFEAFGPSGDPLGTLGPVTVGDATSYTGDTDEDRFFGVVSMAGISAISLKMLETSNWELDHLQYGRSLEQPAARRKGGGYQAGTPRPGAER
jgi:hypothetical protein